MGIAEMAEMATKLGLLDALVNLYKKYGFGEELKTGMELVIDKLDSMSLPFYGEGPAEEN